MKKTISLIIAFLVSFLFINKLNALQGYTTGSLLNVRTEPTVNSDIIATFADKNKVIDLVDDTLYNQKDPSCYTGWYKMNYNGKVGYICGDYVSTGNTPDNNPSYNEETFEARITDTRVSVRPTPSYNNTAYYELLPGTNVVILEKVTGQVSSRCNVGWYKIRYFKDQIGYTCAAYIHTKEELTSSNAEYETYLKNLGFPDTYIPYLVKLHEQHPSWTFNPLITNTDWNTLISVETYSNAVQNSYLPNIISSIYQKGPLNGESGWFITTDEVNAFFLDPRNFLTEKFIFMFERLNYNYAGEQKGTFDRNNNQVSRYYNMVSYALSGAYSNTDEYKNWLLEGGYNAGVSPLYLAALSYQEGPLSKADNASILGTHSKNYILTDSKGNIIAEHNVNGLYNFFNINAYATKNNGTITNALGYACGERCGFSNSYKRPWDNKKNAIEGGAMWIYDSYLAIGQNSMYFKKFNSNPAPGYSLGGHQYQTNITAPCSESLKLYNTYTATGEINNNFSFDIPVYKNMPSVVSLPDLASNINTLNEIKVNGLKISNDIDILDYEVYIPASAKTAKIEVVKTDSKSSVKGDGEINITEDRTEHKIIVTAENGATLTYRITLIKAEDENVQDLNITIENVTESLSIIDGNVINHISPNTVVDTIKQSILKYSPKTSVVVYNNQGQIVEGAVSLGTGYTIKVTVPSGATKTFGVVINGDTNGDGKSDIIDLLRIQKSILGTTTLDNLYYKGADTNFDGKVDIIDLLRVQKFILGDIKL